MNWYKSSLVCLYLRAPEIQWAVGINVVSFNHQIFFFVINICRGCGGGLPLVAPGILETKSLKPWIFPLNTTIQVECCIKQLCPCKVLLSIQTDNQRKKIGLRVCGHVFMVLSCLKRSYCGNEHTQIIQLTYKLFYHCSYSVLSSSIAHSFHWQLGLIKLKHKKKVPIPCLQVM